MLSRSAASCLRLFCCTKKAMQWINDHVCMMTIESGAKMFTKAWPFHRCECGQCGAPALVAFAGKRQWMELLNCSKKGKARLSRIDLGLQSMRPEVTYFLNPKKQYCLSAIGPLELSLLTASEVRPKPPRMSSTDTNTANFHCGLDWRLATLASVHT